MSRPWEAAAGTRAWETQEVIYPRVVAISRPNTALSGAGGAATAGSSQAGGTVPYAGLRTPASGGETLLHGGVPASIQMKGGRAMGANDLPSNSPGPVRWHIMIPLWALAKGSVYDRDIITDDEGSRYQVSGNYWNSLGYNIEAIRLEA